ncbi:methylated-DNA--[protein]-cysteine S-methyltransferase [Arenicella xantha]|uniref:Methylated-DNA--protein-cysteine methyltransferase n=1 Tax=Arenicella xantha TaxID=644221 RepID=A0A395JLV4_9GAMM|nr:methylated-DNA--[protein]-cysteine S-methyltransferase [Arenicella xantha]RBP51579.1 methylated-DNA-[protein]-cysteine S-methyltransferase [Arenicella xantha]
MQPASFNDFLSTPLGDLEIVATESSVVSILFVEQVRTSQSNAVTEQTKTQLAEYFNGGRRAFDLPLDAAGTEFQQTVWQALRTIPFGETRSYGDVATQIGNPKGSRAVGLANGKNPLTIVVPCHRVIGANGALTGYASGVERKAWLLRHESVI